MLAMLRETTGSRLFLNTDVGHLYSFYVSKMRGMSCERDSEGLSA